MPPAVADNTRSAGAATDDDAAAAPPLVPVAASPGSGSGHDAPSEHDLSDLDDIMSEDDDDAILAPWRGSRATDNNDAPAPNRHGG